MPELPEVETVARSLRRKLNGQTIDGVDVWLDKMVDGDSAEFAARLAGARIEDIGRRGKILLIKTPGVLVGVHLRMTGTFTFAQPDEPLPKHTHLRFTFCQAGFELRYRDVRQFGWFRLVEPGELLSWRVWQELGPDALEVGQEEFLARLAGRRGRIKPLLLNQSFIAGLGNIYADETLFRARLHPMRTVETITREKAAELFRAVQEVLCEAVECGGSSISDFEDAEGALGYFQTRHQVYGRKGQPCPVCGRPIQRTVVGGRSTFFCPFCQPLRTQKVARPVSAG